MKKQMLATTLVLTMATLAACGTTEKEASTPAAPEAPKVLVMGTSADYPPFEYIDTANGNEIIGFDIDLAKLIGEKLGFEVKVEDMDFNSLIPALQSNKFDFVLAGMSPDAEREKVVDFSIPYNETVQMIVTTKESGIETLEDLEGKKLGVQIGSIQEKLGLQVAETIPMTVETRNLIPELVQEIMSKRFDAVIIEDIVAENFASKNESLTYFPVEIDNTDYKAAVFPEGSELKESFNTAIQELIDEGKMEELREKWFTSQE